MACQILSLSYFSCLSQPPMVPRMSYSLISRYMDGGSLFFPSSLTAAIANHSWQLFLLSPNIAIQPFTLSDIYCKLVMGNGNLLTQTYDLIKLNSSVFPEHILFFLNSRPLLMWFISTPKTLPSTTPHYLSLGPSTLQGIFILPVGHKLFFFPSLLVFKKNFINTFTFLLDFSFIAQKSIILVNDSVSYSTLTIMKDWHVSNKNILGFVCRNAKNPDNI